MIPVNQEYKKIWLKINIEYWNKIKAIAALKGIPAWKLMEELIIDYLNRSGLDEIDKLGIIKSD